MSRQEGTDGAIGAALPFVGREHELRALATGLARPGRAIVILRSSPGMGATTLMEHLAARVPVARLVGGAELRHGDLAALTSGGLLIDVLNDVDVGLMPAVVAACRKPGARMVGSVRKGAGLPGGSGLLGLATLDLDLPPLSPGPMAELYSPAIRADPAGPDPVWWCERIGGVPAVAGSLLSAHAGEQLAARDRDFVLTDPWSVQDDLAEVIGDRRPIGSPTRHLIDTLALLRDLPIQHALSVFGPEAVDEALATGMVRWHRESTDSLALSHSATGVISRSVVPPDVARTWVQRCAEAVESDTADSVQGVVWRVRAGLPVEPARLLAAAEAASRSIHRELAVELAVAAQQRAPGPDAQLLLAEALLHAGRHQDAMAAAGSGPEDARQVLVRERIVAWAGAPVRGERISAAMARALTAQAHLVSGRLDQAWQEGEPLARDPGQPDDVRLHAGFAAAMALQRLGRPVAALELVRLLWPAARRGIATAPSAAEWLRSVELLSRMTDADVDGLDASGALLGDEDVLYDSLASRAAAHALRCVTRGMRGLLNDAIMEGISAGRLLVDADPSALWVPPWPHIATAAAMRGDTSTARFVLGVATFRPRIGALLIDPMWARAQAWAAAASGDVAEAVEILRDAATRSSPADRVLLLHDAHRCGAAPEKVLAELPDLSAADGWFLPTMVAEVEATARADGAALETLAVQLEERGLILHAAEVYRRAAAASGRPGESTRRLLTLTGWRHAARARRLRHWPHRYGRCPRARPRSPNWWCGAPTTPRSPAGW